MNKTNARNALRLSVLLLGLLTLTGCFSMYQRDHSSRSSLDMSFLLVLMTILGIAVIRGRRHA